HDDGPLHPVQTIASCYQRIWRIERRILGGPNDPFERGRVASRQALASLDHCGRNVHRVYMVGASHETPGDKPRPAADIQHAARLIDDETGKDIKDDVRVWWALLIRFGDALLLKRRGELLPQKCWLGLHRIPPFLYDKLTAARLRLEGIRFASGLRSSPTEWPVIGAKRGSHGGKENHAPNPP